MKISMVIVTIITALISGLIFTQLNAQEAIKPSIITSTENKTVTLNVPGMNCPTCLFTVRKSLEKVPGVLEVKTSSDTRTAVIKYNASKVNINELITATKNVGYPSTLHKCKDKAQAC